MAQNVMRHRDLRDIPALFISLGFAAVTLPKAIILWNEPDPRQHLEPDEAVHPTDPTLPLINS